jgi:hypothetical protein
MTVPPKLPHPDLPVSYILCAQSTSNKDYASMVYHDFIGERVSPFSAYCTHWKKCDLFFSESFICNYLQNYKDKIRVSETHDSD